MVRTFNVVVSAALFSAAAAEDGKGFEELSEAAAFLGVPEAELTGETHKPEAGDTHWSTSLPAHMWQPCSHTYCKIETRGTHVGADDPFGFNGVPWGVVGHKTAVRTFHNGRETMGRAHKCTVEDKDATKACSCRCAHESQLDRLGDMFSGFTTAATSACAHAELWSANLQCSGAEIPHGDAASTMEKANVYNYGGASDPRHEQFCQYTCEDVGATCVSFDTVTGACKCYGGAATAVSGGTATTKTGTCKATAAITHVLDDKAALHWYQLSSTYGSSWGRKRAAQMLQVPTHEFASLAAQRSAREVDINTASKDELDELYGVGPAIAAKIIAHRDASGYFNKVGDLALVSGISKKSVSNMFLKASAAYSRPTVHECWFHADVCPNHPNEPVGQWRRNTWHNAAQTSEAECFKRARDYWFWCGNSDGDTVTSRYLATGGTTFVEKVERCEADKELAADGKCVRTGCWRTISSCPNNPTNPNIGAWVKYTYSEVNEAQCHEQGYDLRTNCGLTTGMSAARWYDRNGLVVSMMTAQCAKGYAPHADTGMCQKVGCWQRVSSCPFQPSNFMIGKERPNLWTQEMTFTDMTKETCAATAKKMWDWCKIDGPEETATATWHGMDGEENDRMGTRTTYDASMA
jgi:competence ComEA-like helix-hairpin-helix protein